MKKKKRMLINKKGSSVVEFMALIVFLLSLALVFQRYIVLGLGGQWKKAGDAFSHGKAYDPRPFGFNGDGGGTLACVYAQEVSAWVSEDCMEKICDCTLPKEDDQYFSRCPGCLAANCMDAYCQ